MRATLFIFALVVAAWCAWTAVAPAQFAIGVGGWDTGYHASTAAEGALTGMANAISAQGQFNLSASEAAINMREAQRREIENRGKWTETYFEMRRANKAYHDSLKRPRDPEAALRFAESQRPKRLSLSDLGVSGDIHWPAGLSADKFADERQELDRLFAERAQKGSLSAREAAQAQATTRAMLEELRANIESMRPSDYTRSRQFIVSLSYEASLPVD